MAKPLPQRFPSDDFETTVGGRTYHPHEGEYVEIFVDRSVDEVLSAQALTHIGAQIQAVQGDPDEALRLSQLATEHFDRVCEALADRVADWTWTDRRGNPLPKPDGTSGPISRLTNEEVGYLLGLKESDGESLPNDDGASRRSPTTSSATASTPSRTSSGGARSRAKR